MAQMFSSGVTPEYLQSLATEYAKYFPKQQAVNTEALQQWYSPDGSAAFAAPMDASATMAPSSSVVGSLFGDQYPQVHQGGGNQQMGQGTIGSSVSDGTGFSGDFSGLASGLSALGSMGMFGPMGKLASAAYSAYNKARPYGTAPTMSDANLAAAIAGQDVANARDNVPSYEGPSGTRGSDGGGVATGGVGGDASGGGDRGTRGGF